MIIRTVYLFVLFASLVSCSNRFERLQPSEREVSLLVQQFIEDLDIRKIQKTSKVPYMELTSLEYSLSEEDRNEFDYYVSNKQVKWNDYAIRKVWKRTNCFNKKNCYIIFYPIFSKDKNKAILSFQIDTKNGGFNKSYIYKKIQDRWQQVGKLPGYSGWLYC